MTECTHHAKYLLPGSFFSEDESRELPERTVEAALHAAPDRAFAFQFYDTAVVDFEFDTALFRVLPRALNESPTHYIGGDVFTVEELRLLAIKEGDPDKYRVLISNVEGNGWPAATRTRMGNWQPFEDGMVRVPEQVAA